MAIVRKQTEYTKDLTNRDRSISFIKDANEIAELYRQVVVIVRDSIRDKIIPEMGLIKAFLYADAIREIIVDGEKPTDVHPYSIEEYKNTAQDMHYQFVKNAFDFYNISTNFFRKTILSDIIADKVVTEEEKRDFNEQIEAIKNSVKRVEEKKVL